MVVYIEYAFLENFIIDACLLILTFFATKQKVKPLSLILSACLGSIFALLYPFFALSNGWLFLLKLSCSLVMCSIPLVPLKNKKDWGRYGITYIFFIAVTFLFGGGLLAFNQTNLVKFLLVFICLILFVLSFICKLYQKAKLEKLLFDCTVILGKNKGKVRGFLDSGNLAQKNNLPVCFISAETFLNLFDESLSRETMRIQTMSGEKNIPLYLGEIQIQNGAQQTQKAVYFSPTGNMLAREYDLLLQGNILM